MRRAIQNSILVRFLALFVFPFSIFLGCSLADPASQGAEEKKPAVEPAKHEAYTEKIAKTDVAFDMVPIPGGTFDLGSAKDEKDRGEDEGPQHPVKIAPFWMGKYEVTWDEYDVFRTEEGVKKPEDNDKKLKADADAVTGPTPTYVDAHYNFGGGKQACIAITHHAAMEYCYWLSKRTGKKYRLPTEAEWEWACRAGTKTAYFFGDDPKNLGDYAWFAGNSDDQPHKVGEKKPNPWGLYDILGNVSEWCLDHYQKDAYTKCPLDKPTLQPVLLPTEDRQPDVVRGGSWVDEPKSCRCATRVASEKAWYKQDPQRPQSIWWLTDADFVGFRVVRAVEEQDNLKGLRSKVTLDSK
jgi:formylglycine-generating enzyme required for sulfatase activity